MGPQQSDELPWADLYWCNHCFMVMNWYSLNQHLFGNKHSQNLSRATAFYPFSGIEPFRDGGGHQKEEKRKMSFATVSVAPAKKAKIPQQPAQETVAPTAAAPAAEGPVEDEAAHCGRSSG